MIREIISVGIRERAEVNRDTRKVRVFSVSEVRSRLRFSINGSVEKSERRVLRGFSCRYDEV